MGVVRVPYRVIFGDTDAAGIVYHANYLRMWDMARSEWFRTYSLPPLTMFQVVERYILVVETHLEHKRPARFDEALTIEAWLSTKWVRPASLRFEYRIYGENGDLIVRGYTRHAFTDSRGAIKRPPRDFIDSLRAATIDRDFQHGPDHA